MDPNKEPPDPGISPTTEKQTPNNPLPRDPPKNIDHLVSIEHARFIEISSETKKLSQLNIILRKNFIQNKIGRPAQIKPQSNGNLVVETLNSSQSETLLNLNMFLGIPVTVTAPARLNCIKGDIRGPGLRELSVDDIILSAEVEDGVIDAKHYPRRNNITKQLEKANSVTLTFHNKILPSHVHIGYVRYPVELHIPRPLRCYHCQTYGHHTTRCPKLTESPICPKCSDPHDGKTCEVQDPNYLCANCKGPHPVWYRTCPVYETETKICEFKVRNDLISRGSKGNPQENFHYLCNST